MAVLTKSKQVENYLRNLIIGGHWSAGKMIPAERELLVELNVSRSTLREALNSLVNEGLVKRKQGSGTYVSDRSKSGSIAIAVSGTGMISPMGYWQRSLVKRAQDMIAAEGQNPALWVGTDFNQDGHMSDTSLFTNTNLQYINGVLSTAQMDKRLDRRLAKENIHCVNVTAAVPLGRYCVVLDFDTLVNRASRLLIEHGYYDFAIMWNPVNTSSDDEFLYPPHIKIDQLNQAAVNFDSKRYLKITSEGQYSQYQKVYENFRDLLAKPDRPRAIFFADDSCFDVASRAILELGIKVPDELAIVSHANVGREFHFPMSVTRIGFSADEVITAAWNMLKMLMAGEDVDEPICYVQPVVMEGESL